MPTALISDIHSNLEALSAVIADAEKRGCDRIICLGDITGYGPNPLECVDLIMEKCTLAMMGNHDFAVLYEPTSFNASAEQSTYWTRTQFEQEPDLAKRKARFEFLGNLSIRHSDDEGIFVHASPRRPINEYVFPDDATTAPVKMQQIYDRIPKRCFTGHTHVPGVFTDEPDFYPPSDLGGKYTFTEDEKCIINPGSVGQPRDRDPRASYAILTDSAVEFFRVEYDIESVVKKVLEIPMLNDFLGTRLREGR